VYEAGYALNGKKSCISLPRRMAVVSLARRVAEEMRSEMGGVVGYKVRFDQKCSVDTPIVFMTDGMLINEMMRDPLLSEYSIIMVDDIHERTLSSDMALGLLKKIRKKRPNLKIIISSATLEAN